ncbi:MAG: peptidase U32 family protein [Bacillota bacterium]
MKKIELLAPAGNLEKLKIAVLYGADAVYCGGHNFGLRAGADNFTLSELAEGTDFCHKHGARIYITVNMIPHNQDLGVLPGYLKELQGLGVDGLIISDPGVLEIIRDQGIELPLHLSTQANAVNWASVSFWKKQGLSRIILARELSRGEIADINQQTDIELEMFIHGSMCISYSGRCLLSDYLAHRDANKGQCAHSCRWKYYLVEEERPGEYHPIVEDDHGTYIMNSRDLCLIEYIPEVLQTGVDSLKIEGRMKGMHYVAAVTGVYRQALDSYLTDPENYQFKQRWLDELHRVSNRTYTTGFFLGQPDAAAQRYDSSSYQRTYDFMGIVRDYDQQRQQAVVEVRHKFFKGDKLEIIGPGISPIKTRVDYIINQQGKKVETAPHPRELIRIPVAQSVSEYYIVRRKRGDEYG